MPDKKQKKENITPGDILDNEDLGDDMQARIRYQHGYASIQCLRMLSDNPPIAVFCENHEDILVEESENTFTGIQVKTRKFSRDPFNTIDKDLKKSFARFARLEKKFPESFSGYSFVTNHSFWTEKDDDFKNPEYFVRYLSERKTIKGLRNTNPIKKFINSLCQEYDIEEINVVAAISKTALIGYESGLDHNYQDLIEIIGKTNDLGSNYSLTAIQKIADNLIYKIYNSSSRKISKGNILLYDPKIDIKGIKDELTLNGKKIVVDDVDKIINDSLKEDADNMLISEGLSSKEGLPPGMDVMKEKLSKGKVEKERVDVMGDARASMEHKYLKWNYKYGEKKAKQNFEWIENAI